MREEGLVYDAQIGGFMHVYSDGGKIIIDKEACQHDHFALVVGAG